MELKHQESETRNRFYLEDDGKEVGEMTYIYVKDHIIDLNHTEIDKSYRGQNLGQKLIEAVIDYARKNELNITASCPYAKKMIEKNDNYNDVKV